MLVVCWHLFKMQAFNVVLRRSTCAVTELLCFILCAHVWGIVSIGFHEECGFVYFLHLYVEYAILFIQGGWGIN